MLLSPKKTKFFLILVSALLIADQWTKYLIHSRFRLGESLVLIEHLFAFTYVRNYGAAFGFLNNAPAAFREPFFLAIPILALVFLFYMLYRMEDHKTYTVVALCMIISGAVGNLIDRLRFGYVIDFIDVHWKEFYHWPAFNIADSCIVVGVTILFIESFMSDMKVRRAARSSKH